MNLSSVDSIDEARTFAKGLKGSGSEFFDVCARELIAQAVFTLSKRTPDWGSDQLLDQITRPREAFDQQGLADGMADTMFFDVENRQADAVRATAAFIVTYVMPPVHREAA